MSATCSKAAHTLRAAAAGRQLVNALPAAEAAFVIVGKDLLPEAARQALRVGVIEQAIHVTGQSAPLLLQIGEEAVPLLTRGLSREPGKAVGRLLARGTGWAATRTATGQVSRQAAKVIARSAANASLIGGAIDLCIGAAEGIHGVRTGRMKPAQALGHAAKEAATGGAAAAAGVGAVAAVVFVTGPIGWGAALAITGGASIGAKLGLTALFG